MRYPTRTLIALAAIWASGCNAHLDLGALQPPAENDSGVGNDPTDAELACYSPTQHLEIAYRPGAIGCSCEPATASACVPDATGRKVALLCLDGRWQAGEDGPCDQRRVRADATALEDAALATPLAADMEVREPEDAAAPPLATDAKAEEPQDAAGPFDVVSPIDAALPCYSPTQNLERAYQRGAVGCTCGANPLSVCASDATGRKVALVCEEGHWQSVEDGPCEPAALCYSPTQNLERAYDSAVFGCSCEETAVSVCVADATGREVALECRGGHWQSVEDGACEPAARPLAGGTFAFSVNAQCNGGSTYDGGFSAVTPTTRHEVTFSADLRSVSLRPESRDAGLQYGQEDGGMLTGELVTGEGSTLVYHMHSALGGRFVVVQTSPAWAEFDLPGSGVPFILCDQGVLLAE